MAFSDIKVVLDLDDKGSPKVRTFVKNLGEIDKASKRTTRTMRNAESAMGGFMGRMRDVLINAYIIKGSLMSFFGATRQLHMGLVETNAELEKATFLLKGMSTASSEAARQMEAEGGISYLLQMAEKTPFSMKEMTNSFVKMRTVGIDPMKGSLSSLTDAIASFGGDDQLLHRASIAIQQMAGKGVVSMEELRQQLGEAVPSAMKSMSKSMNMSMSDFVKAVSDGRVEATSAINKMFLEFQKSMGGAGERMMSTWSGMVSVLQTRWLKFQKEVGDAGLFSAAKDALQELIDAMDIRNVGALARSIGEGMASIIRATKDAVLWMSEYGSAVVEAIKAAGIFAVAMFGLSRAVKIVQAGMLAQRLATIAAAREVIALKRANKDGIATTDTWIATNKNWVRSTTIATRRTVVFKRAVMGLRSVFAALGGPIGVTISLLSMAVGWFSTFGQEGRRAYEEVAKGAEILGKRQRKLVEQEIADKERELARLDAKIKEGFGNGVAFDPRVTFDPLGGAVLGAQLKQISFKELKELSAERAKLAAEIDSAKKQISTYDTNQAEHTTDKSVAAFRRQMAERFATAQATYNKETNAHYDLLNDKKITEKQYQEFAVAQSIQLGNTKREIIKQMKADIIDGGNAESEVNKKILKELEQALSEANKEQLAWVKSQASANKMLEHTNKALTRQKSIVKEIASIFEREKGKLGELGDKVAVLSGGQEKGLDRTVLVLRRLGKEAGLSAVGVEALADSYKRVKAEQDSLKTIIGLSSALVKNKERLVSLDLESGSATSLEYKKSLEIERLATKYKQMDFGRLSLEQATVAAKQFAANVKVIEKTYDVLQQQEDSKKSLEIAKQINDYNKRAEALRASIGTETQIRATQHEVEKKQIKERWNFELKGQKATAEQKKALTNLLIALDEKYADDNKSQLKKIIEDWSDSTDSIRSVWTAAMDGMADNLTEFFMTGKAGWEDYANMVVRMIAKIMIQKQIAGIVGSMFSGGQAGQQSTAMTATAFANGGVMTQYGSAQLKKYATGGIANSPQLALYGEGSMPEAYVPLPDGRTIPVTMSGGDQGGASSIQLNIINESGQDVEAESRGQPRFDGERMVLDVVLNAVSKPGKFRSGMKSALSK